MHFALLNYAADHDGRFPSSVKGSWDALQALFPGYAAGIELAGISGDDEAVLAALRNGTPLDPSLTSWIYVQGLRKDDDPSLAVLWESKGGLYPNGRRNWSGGHAVLLVGGDITNVPAVDWDSFLRQQEQLRTHVQARRTAATNIPVQTAP